MAIIRTKTQATGGITPEEKILLDAHAKRWIANAFQTGRTNRAKLTEAIKGLYRVSGLNEPIVVVVPSPFVMVMAGTAASLFYSTRVATDATDATDATRAATYAATRAATLAATDAATLAATYATYATYATDATRAATLAATDAATLAATYATDAAFNKLLSNWYSFYAGGNMWSAYDCYLSAMRDVIGLQFTVHKKYKYWEAAAKLGGFRYMHEKFCIVCDFPDVININADNQPHCDDGPSHRWSDGWSIWNIDGIRVDEQIVMHPETQTIEQINAEVNADIRSIRITRFGWPRYLRESGAKCIDTRDNEIEGTKEALYRTGNNETRLVATCATGRIFAMGVPPQIQTCEAAQRYLAGDRNFKIVGRT